MQIARSLREREQPPLPTGVKWIPSLRQGKSLRDFQVGGPTIYLLEAGLAMLERSRGGNRWDCLGYRRPDSAFGELQDARKRPFVKRITAMEECSFFEIERARLREVLKSSPDIALKLRSALIQDAQAIEDRAALFDHTTLKERLPYFLVDLAITQADGKTIFIPHNQDILAKIIGGSRSTLNQMLMDYKRRKILTDSARTIINGPAGLQLLERLAHRQSSS